MKFFTAALRRLVESACLKLPFHEVAGTINFTAECVRIFVRGCRKQKEFRKQDQIGILAQKNLLCGKLRLELFRDGLFRTRMHVAVKCRDGNCRAEGAGVTSRRVRRRSPAQGVEFVVARGLRPAAL
jgi:hypothetical protein